MGKAGAKVGKGTRNDLHHDRHTVSLLTDHLVFSPKYKRKVLEGEVGEVTEKVEKLLYTYTYDNCMLKHELHAPCLLQAPYLSDF